MTLIGIAAHYAQPEVFKDLLERGADINAADELGDSVLAFAACGGSADIVGLLLTECWCRCEYSKRILLLLLLLYRKIIEGTRPVMS